MQSSNDSFQCRTTLAVGSKQFTYFRLNNIEKKGLPSPARLPYSLKILLENLLRTENGSSVKAADIEALVKWDPKSPSEKEISFTPARVILQDFTGVPVVVDLAAMRDAMKKFGKNPKTINPLQPVDLVIDHSVQVDYFGSPEAFDENVKIEFERNQERYQFLRWGQKAFNNFRVVPPGTGIVHQVNLEYLAPVVFSKKENGETVLYPDTVVGTDSHTTMINGLGVVGWGVGGIEAEAAMLGQPISMLIPEVVGFKLIGELKDGITATDLVLTITQMLRKKGVVGKFVEFFGQGLESLSLPDRATIANMAPEYGATIGFFPVDQKTLDYLALSARPKELIQCVEAYSKEQGLFRTAQSPDPIYSDTLELNLSDVQASLAGPKRPQDRVILKDVRKSFEGALTEMVEQKKTTATVSGNGLKHGDVVIAAITSCTNTSNPAVMLGAGILAKKAVARGLTVKPWVKTSLAPGSKVVMEYLRKNQVLEALEKLQFNLVGFGCTTCIGNSGPLPEKVASEVTSKNLLAVSVLSGNRNFEGRVNSLVRANYLASPPLVVAYAIAGTVNIDLTRDPIGQDAQGKPVFLHDIWPSTQEVQAALKGVGSEMFQKQYAHVFEGDKKWQMLSVPGGDTFAWDTKSTYVKYPPYFEGMSLQAGEIQDIENARVLVVAGDSVTTDHISPAGSIAKDSPAGRYLTEHGVSIKDFNSYGARRGNHEVMVRGTFANVRFKNLLASGKEGSWTRHLPDGEVLSIFETAEKYRNEKIPLVVLAGKEYGTGSSRDWAAKGPALLGVRVVIAESFERIHRSNLIGMGILPLEFEMGQTRQTLQLTGEELYSFLDLKKNLKPRGQLQVLIKGVRETRLNCRVRIDTPEELAYYQHGGILQYVLRQLIQKS